MPSSTPLAPPRPAEPSASAWAERTNRQRAALRRMQWIASGLLAAMLALYAACTLGAAHLPWLGYPAAFAEAATVGACADWFAVTALFRRPLGLPIPHTAILPRNQQRLAESVGVFIAGAFLDPAEIAPRLEALDLAHGLAGWLRAPDHARRLAEAGAALLPSVLAATSDEALRGLAVRLLQGGLEPIPAAPTAGRLLNALLDHGGDRGLYEIAVDQASAFLDDNRASIRRSATEGRGWLSGWIDGRAADAFVTGLRKSLDEAHAPDHPWRGAFHDALRAFAGRLAHDPGLAATCERIKAEALSAKALDRALEDLSQPVRAWLEAGLDRGDAFAAVFARALPAAAEALERDAAARALINRWARALVLNAIVPNRAALGGFVTDVIARWDPEVLVERLELQVGRDLQYIRVNGTVVGGIVGLVLYALTRLAAH